MLCEQYNYLVNEDFSEKIGPLSYHIARAGMPSIDWDAGRGC